MENLRTLAQDKVARYTALQCQYAIADCHDTLRVGQYSYESEYAQKLWAEIDACRDRLLRVSPNVQVKTSKV